MTTTPTVAQRPVFSLPVALLRVVLLTVVQQAGQHKYDNSHHLTSYYDFVVVGAGSAGSVVASRVSEVTGWRVLLLEAGGEPPPESQVPGLFGTLLNGEADWSFTTLPQKHALWAFKDRTTPFNRGRVVGGSSTINYMMYVRGNRRDFDNWEALGNPGWDYASVLPFFMRSEDYTGTRHANTTGEYHGRGGPVSVVDKPWYTPLLQGFLSAGQELGYQLIDANGPEMIGFSVPEMTIKDGRRCSTAEGYLKPASNRPNLHVATHAHVTKILFDKSKRAVGVRFDHNGKSGVALVKREVVVSGGAVSSPHLLMLSGVGPASHLTQHGIPVVADLPGVGSNLQDHASIFGLTWTTNPGYSLAWSTLTSPTAIADYIFRRKGPLSMPFPIEAHAWIESDEGDPYWPQLQFLFLAGTALFDQGIAMPDLLGYDRKFFYEYFWSIRDKEGFSISPMLTRAKSRGKVTLQSPDPYHHPAIDPNYLSHPHDVTTLVKGIKFALKVGNSRALREGFGAKFHDKVVPGCEGEAAGSDDGYWACVVRHLTSTSYHPAGTCKMAPASDPYGVVDHRLRVRGVSGLRVVDASIMPLVVSANTNAATIMIGERASHFIRRDWLSHPTPSPSTFRHSTPSIKSATNLTTSIKSATNLTPSIKSTTPLNSTLSLKYPSPTNSTPSHKSPTNSTTSLLPLPYFVSPSNNLFPSDFSSNDEPFSPTRGNNKQALSDSPKNNPSSPLSPYQLYFHDSNNT